MAPGSSITCQVGLYFFRFRVIFVIGNSHKVCFRSITYKKFRGRVQACSPCKKFCRRNCKRSSLQCLSQTFTCTIDARERLRHGSYARICPRCRLAKCYQVGLHEQLQLHEPQSPVPSKRYSDVALLTAILSLLDAPTVKQNSGLLETVAAAAKQVAAMRLQGKDVNGLLTSIITFILTAAFCDR